MDLFIENAPFDEKYLASLPCFDGIYEGTASWYGGLIKAHPERGGVMFSCDFPEKEAGEFLDTARRAAKYHV